MTGRFLSSLAAKLHSKESSAVRQRYFLLLCLIAITAISGFTYIIYKHSQEMRMRDQWVVHTYEVLRVARLAISNTLEMESGYQGYFLTRSEKFLNPAKEASRSVIYNLTLLLEMTSDNPVQQKRISSLQAMVKKAIETQNAYLSRYRRGGRAALSANDLEASRRLMAAIREQFNIIVNEERNLLDERQIMAQQEKRNYSNTLFISAAITLLGLLLANGAIALFLARAREAQKALRDAREIYSMVLQGTDDGVYDYSPLTGAVVFSSEYKKQLGYADSEFPDDWERGFNDLLHPEDAELLWEQMHKFMRRDLAAFSETFRLRHRDGTWRWILARAVGLWDEEGRVRRLLGVHTDITEQKKRENELQELNTELESFAYIASHDLRAPLVNLRGFSEEIQLSLNKMQDILRNQKIANPVDQKTVENFFEKDFPESISFIRSAIDRMEVLTTALLNLSRIGRRDYVPVAVNMNKAVQRCLDSLAYEINQKNAAIHMENLPDITADPTAIDQIFSNILDNAVKYLDDKRPGVILISGHKGFDENIYVIRDNGIGIKKSDAGKIYDIFRRASNVGQVRGLGMGMAYVKATVRKINGRIWFESMPDEGTIFYIALPLQP